MSHCTTFVVGKFSFFFRSGEKTGGSQNTETAPEPGGTDDQDKTFTNDTSQTVAKITERIGGSDEGNDPMEIVVPTNIISFLVMISFELFFIRPMALVLIDEL